MRFSYDSLGNAVSVLYNGTEYYYMRNLQGDVIGLINKNGEWVVRYRYDAETGFYYVSSRYYDPQLCRFISADTTDILGVSSDLYDKNLYAYCDNNPVTRADSNGSVAGLVAQMVSDVITSALNGRICIADI